MLDEHAAAFVQLPAGRRCRHRDRLRAHHVPFLEAQRPVVHAGGQAEAVFGERRLAAKVAAEHAADLRNGHMTFVGEHQRIVGHIFEQRRRRLAGAAAGQIAGIVLDAGAGAVASIISRSKVVRCSSRCASKSRPCLDQPVEPLLQLGLDRLTACTSVGRGVT